VPARLVQMHIRFLYMGHFGTEGSEMPRADSAAFCVRVIAGKRKGPARRSKPTLFRGGRSEPNFDPGCIVHTRPRPDSRLQADLNEAWRQTLSRAWLTDAFGHWGR
jgi:hypothetical protein